MILSDILLIINGIKSINDWNNKWLFFCGQSELVIMDLLFYDMVQIKNWSFWNEEKNYYCYFNVV